MGGKLFTQSAENARDAFAGRNTVVIEKENATGYDVNFHLNDLQIILP
jgi:hypothetical protein